MKEEATLKCRCGYGDCPPGHKCGYICAWLKNKDEFEKAFWAGKVVVSDSPRIRPEYKA